MTAKFAYTIKWIVNSECSAEIAPIKINSVGAPNIMQILECKA